MVGTGLLLVLEEEYKESHGGRKMGGGKEGKPSRNNFYKYSYLTLFL